MNDPATIQFTCASCGGSFRAPDAASSAESEAKRLRQFVRIGGRVLCEVCAAKRFNRRRRIDADCSSDRVVYVSHCRGAVINYHQ